MILLMTRKKKTNQKINRLNYFSLLFFSFLGLASCKTLTPDSLTVTTGMLLPGVSFRWDLQRDHEADIDSLISFLKKEKLIEE